MSSGYIYNGKRIKKVGVLLEPSTYDADITPEDMQRGMTAYAKGKKVIGTGKCFAFCAYGQEEVDLIFDENGNEKYGVMIKQDCNSNVFFISSTPDSDIIAQDIFIINETQEGKAVKVGVNKSTLADIFAFHLQGYLYVYSALLNSKTTLNYFIGKDNKI